MFGRSWRISAGLLAMELAVAGCGAAGVAGNTTPKGLSQAQVNSFATQIANAFSNGMKSSKSTAPVVAAAAEVWPTTTAGVDVPFVMPFADGVPPGISRTLVNVSVAQRTNCTAGGNINVTGGMTGSLNDQGTGVLLLQLTETISNWQCIGGYVMDGDPYLSAAGTFSFLNGVQSTAASISFGGGFRWSGSAGSGSCQTIMTALFNPDGTGRLSGTMCGYQVNITY